MFLRETAPPLTTVLTYVFPMHLWAMFEKDGGVVSDFVWKECREGQKDFLRKMPEMVKIKLDAQGLREKS